MSEVLGGHFFLYSSADSRQLNMTSPTQVSSEVTAPPGPAPDANMVWIPGGTYQMGL